MSFRPPLIVIPTHPLVIPTNGRNLNVIIVVNVVETQDIASLRDTTQPMHPSSSQRTSLSFRPPLFVIPNACEESQRIIVVNVVETQDIASLREARQRKGSTHWWTLQSYEVGMVSGALGVTYPFVSVGHLW